MGSAEGLTPPARRARFTVLVPARYASTRLPAKALADLCGKPMVVRVAERARQSGADRVVIASSHDDDESLLAVVRAFKSTGVPVSLLPRPLDLLDGPATTPSRVGGVPLIEVQALAARRSVP